jgi:prevent-host-death family protein
MSASPDHKTR